MTEHSARNLAHEVVAEIYPLLRRLATEDDPEARPITLETEIRRRRAMPPHVDGLTVVARNPAGSVDGILDCTWYTVAGLDHVTVRIRVFPDARRRGLGSALLARASDAADAQGRRLLWGWTRATSPGGEAFCRRLGADVAQVIRESRLDLEQVDRDLIERWVREGPSRACGYSLLFVEGPTPDDLMDDALHLAQVLIDTAPRDNLSYGDRRVTAEELRSEEEASLQMGVIQWVLYAHENATGRLVGRTDLLLGADDPERLEVGTTVVDPDHRGRALGKWLKATMVERALDILPDARRIVTYNAASNDAMLGINQALGFRPAPPIIRWQVPVDRVRQHLASR